MIFFVKMCNNIEIGTSLPKLPLETLVGALPLAAWRSLMCFSWFMGYAASPFDTCPD